MHFTDWFHLDKVLKSQDGKDIEIWSFNHDADNSTLMSEWAKNFRNAYCDDSCIDEYLDGYDKTRKEYLLDDVFPDKSDGWGPATRSGDFSEILIADFLQYVENYQWIPSKIRYDNKDVRNSSTQGSDVVAVKYADESFDNPNDELCIIEVKAKYTGKNVKKQLEETIRFNDEKKFLENRLQDAVDDSHKDFVRVGEFLNFANVKYIQTHKVEEAKKIKRFLNIYKHPYKKKFGAAAFFDMIQYDDIIVTRTFCSEHLEKNNLRLLVVLGQDMMKLVHSLYNRAADEA